jgi:hypothetical protein
MRFAASLAALAIVYAAPALADPPVQAPPAAGGGAMVSPVIRRPAWTRIPTGADYAQDYPYDAAARGV